MRRLGLGLAAAFALLAAMPAWADNCSDMRANIAAMDAKSSGLPGYLDLRLTLSLLYSKLCRRTAAREGEFWYDIDGKKLGPATGDRPEGAAYTATDEVAKSCADSGNPSMCAMIRGSVAMCANPPEGEAKRACVVAGGYPTGQPLEEDVDAPALPPVPIMLAGRRYSLPEKCAGSLAGLPENLSRLLQNSQRRSGFAMDLQRDCPADFLDALADRIGASPDTLADALPKLGQLVGGGFDVPGAGAARPAQTAWADPRFREMCRQAAANNNTCRQRQIDIGSCSQAADPKDDDTCRSVNQSEKKTRSGGQNAAFGDCAALYGSVDRMCKLTEGRATMPPPAPLPVVAKPAPPPPPPAAKPIDGMAHSAPPPKPQPSRCQQLVSNYVSAAQANDGPRALAGYNALKAEGGCNVLDKVDTGMPAAPPAQAFPSRRGNTLTHQYVDPCAADPANCARAMGQLEQQAGPEAKAALMMHAISTGLQLGAAMANGLAAMQPQGGGGGGTNYNSIGNRPAARTYGQGSPQAAPHQQLPTPGPCGPGPVCTAR